MNMSKRRSFLVAAGQLAAGAASSLILLRSAKAGESLPRTPPSDLGPFYPVEKPVDDDADLTRIRGRDGRQRAAGQVIEVSGRIVTSDGRPQPHARIELWQANAAGRYAHANDRRPDVPLDPNFQGYADLRADAGGNFRFLTVKPGVYPAGSFLRAPHIHFDVRGRSQRLVTQMYFPGDDALLKQDQLVLHDLWGKADPLPTTIVARRHPEGSRSAPGALRFQFDIVLFDGVM
jgi:protocatechuate 3,4-dioxygenase beta subunit